MTDQEIIDAIDAEIAKTESLNQQADLSCPEAAEMVMASNFYITGLYFARALIVKRMEGGK